MNENTSVSVLKDTKRRLDKYKKKYGTYEGVISNFLQYFESTNINPSDISLNPTALVKNGTDRMIKILKNIEIKKIDKILNVVEYIAEKVDNPNLENKAKDQDKVSSKNLGGLSEDEVQELAQKLVEFENEISSQKEEIQTLNKRISEANNLANSSKSDNFEPLFLDIKKYLNELTENAKKSGIASNDLKIDAGIFKRNIQTITNLITNR